LTKAKPNPTRCLAWKEGSYAVPAPAQDGKKLIRIQATIAISPSPLIPFHLKRMGGKRGEKGI